MHRPVLYISQVLGWVDAFHERTGRWPKMGDGRVARSVEETWMGLDMALRTATGPDGPGSDEFATVWRPPSRPAGPEQGPGYGQW